MDSRIEPFPTPLSRQQLFCHRSYKPTGKRLSFRGESFDLAAVLAELAKIREKCRFYDLSQKDMRYTRRGKHENFEYLL